MKSNRSSILCVLVLLGSASAYAQQSECGRVKQEETITVDGGGTGSSRDKAVENAKDDAATDAYRADSERPQDLVCPETCVEDPSQYFINMELLRSKAVSGGSIDLSDDKEYRRAYADFNSLDADNTQISDEQISAEPYFYNIIQTWKRTYMIMCVKREYSLQIYSNF